MLLQFEVLSIFKKTENQQSDAKICGPLLPRYYVELYTVLSISN